MVFTRSAFAVALVGALAALFAVAQDGDDEVAKAITAPLEKILFEDPMTGDWQENWFLDGKEATLKSGDDGLYFAAGTIAKWHDPEKYHGHHAVLWTKREFAGDIRISYEMTRKDDGDGATLLYIQARGVGRPPYVKDIREWSHLREIPAMSEYYTYMDLLSISFREDLRLRRYPWKDKDGKSYPENGLVAPKLDYRIMAPGDSYFVVVEKRNPHLTLRLYGRDRTKPEVEHTWDTSTVSENRDPPLIQEGRIGLRQMATRQFVYKNFKVEQLGSAAAGPLRAEAPVQAGASKFSNDTVVYWEPGSKRGHIDGCRRLTPDATERGRLKTTLGVMKAGGGELCSRCPGSELNQEREQAESKKPSSKKPSSNKPASKGLPESWVKPGPDVVPKHVFETNSLEPLVAIGSDGRLVYREFSRRGDKIPDFSTAGYMHCETPIPNVPTVETLRPPKGDAQPQANMEYPVGADSHAVIQAALDRVAALPSAKDGYRGAVVLGKGTWFLESGLLLRSGVVLRGEGDGEDGTRLVFTIPSGQGVGILLGDVADAGTTESIPILLTGVLGERTLPNGNEGFALVLDDGRELATRTGDVAHELAANVGKRVTLEYVGIVNTQGGRRRVTLKHTKPSALEVLGEGAAAAALDPDLVLPELEPAAGATSTVKIADGYVPTGATRLRVTSASAFSAGDMITIQKTTNAKWIDVLGVGERLRHIRGGADGLNKKPWGPQSFGHIRHVTAVEGDTLVFDMPLPQSIDAEHGGGTVTKLTDRGPDAKIGVESLRIVSNYDTAVEDTGKDANFRNLESGIVVGSVDSWVRNCTVLHVWQSAVRMEDAARITVRDCRSLEPVGPSRGGRRYTFSINGSTGVFVYRCFAEDGRHDFVVGARTSGPNAFVECSALRGEQSEPHHRWGSGTLYDNIRMNDGGTLAAINRGDSGSGHGWAAANTVFWNCAANAIVVADPETEGENNFAIGFKGEAHEEYETGGVAYANTRAGYWGTPQEGKYFGYALMGNGYIQSPSAAATPDSLFAQQLIDRIGEASARAILE